MFNTILIANRGEIACRVMETARRMGVATVAVYSDADAGAKHVAMADKAVHIGGSAPADSYLRGDAIIEAALATGAQGIHPGYGFLSENPDFVEAVEAAGLTFIGPSADAIRAMGLKDAAKALMAAGRPGSIIHISSQMGHVGGIDRALYCATKHGLEGMVKAMAIEWGKHGVRINTVCPTFIRTPLTQATFDNPERAAWIMDKIKLPRVAEVEDIMGAAVFLASDAAAMITGTALMVDGGWTAD